MIHWLIYGGMHCGRGQKKQAAEIYRYLKEYPSSSIKVYFKNTGDVYAKVIQLKCHQTYDDLDLDIDSGCESLRNVIQTEKYRIQRPPYKSFL